MIANHSATKDAAAYTVLRRLALKAQGYSGADVEKLVRESRQNARRGQRPLTFADLFATLISGKVERPPAMRWRMAVHEAGHAIAYLDLGLGRITAITIDSADGGHIDVDLVQRDVMTEEAASALLVLRLAGRAAEQELLGNVSAGSGGSPDSDLAWCTESAIAMETTLGFSEEWPLLYRPASNRAAIFTHNPSLGARVNTRLEEAYASSRDMIGRHKGAVERLAGALMRHHTLEGAELRAMVAEVLPRILASKSAVGTSVSSAKRHAHARDTTCEC